ncbi:hypothetical protein ROZALSC1DRAFT_27528 [Rozella allomycis CSF55]|uniref:Uncharacterized protein n=1 Tax=Rozella allomycis (strain CSF55) TaxID=988480 RepID=A0A075AXZ5_ROZAC|nr:hypothetical protein O9G_003205 [Rozella allomycis CSF55]RKP21029.1 hypothetical protein ROZALSC1DRAFT_27528 [Rozella allomycis CSF55]|eukprot:EPZ35019.1 hypothetical protein O9G_003205 [Rozella allomycis CSF55]
MHTRSAIGKLEIKDWIRISDWASEIKKNNLNRESFAKKVRKAFIDNPSISLSDVIKFAIRIHNTALDPNIDGHLLHSLILSPACFLANDSSDLLENGLGLVPYNPDNYGMICSGSDIFNNREQFAFCLFSGNQYPTLLRYMRPVVNRTEFADCGETTVLNLLVILIYDIEAKRFDLDRLKLNSRPTPYLSKLIHFFQEYPDVDIINSIRAHNAFTGLVSFLPGVTYSLDGMELTGGFKSFMAVVNNLLGVKSLRQLSYLYYIKTGITIEFKEKLDKEGYGDRPFWNSTCVIS